MNFFAVTGCVVFCITWINIWLEKFLDYQLSQGDYLFRKFFSVTRTIQFNHYDAYKLYTNGVIGVLSIFGLNAVLHSFEMYILPLTLTMYVLNFACFVVHCIYVGLLPFHIVKDYEGLALIYNYIMWLYLNYTYFLTPSHTMYFTYFVILSVPHLFRAYYKLYNYHYDGDNMLIKTLSLYLNYF